VRKIWLTLLMLLALPLGALENGQKAPDFKFKELGSGKQLSLKKLKGKVVLVDFWATWCGPCRMEIPHLIDLQKTYGKKGLEVVGVSLDMQGEAAVKPFMKKWQINYKVVVYDPQADHGELAEQYGGVQAIPSTFLVDRSGRMLKIYQPGYHDRSEFESDIKAALKF
jgi:thiol-disulfide isomerase/thioredoxin